MSEKVNHYTLDEVVVRVDRLQAADDPFQRQLLQQLRSGVFAESKGIS